eukprot:m.49242 g.49242  ORF g.49242 m.49242 type:complete len:269 (+) comp7096_c0_seq1:151-957(+)
MSSAGKADSKKSRREIANHNERRRMQNINSGFEQLRDVLPAYNEAPGDKLSKAAVLSKAHEYILELQQQNQQMHLELMHHRSSATRSVAPVYHAAYAQGQLLGGVPVVATSPSLSRGASISPPLSATENLSRHTPPFELPETSVGAMPIGVAAPAKHRPGLSPAHSRRCAAQAGLEGPSEARVKRRRSSVDSEPAGGQSLDVMLQAIAALEKKTDTKTTATPNSSSATAFQSWPAASMGDGMHQSQEDSAGSDQSKPPISRRLLLTAA